MAGKQDVATSPATSQRAAVPPAYYTTTGAAQALSCSEKYVRLLIERGILPSVKIGSLRRIPVDAIAQFASQCTVRSQHD